MSSIKEITTSIRNALQPLYDEREAAAIAYLYMQHKFEMQRYELVLRGHEEVEPIKMAEIEQELEKLAQGCPVQYVLGETEFYGLPFKVSPAVLIPRQETEELVQMIAQRYAGKHVKIWDVGTGSGCIAVTLAKLLPDAEVFATDISEEALQLARRNAELNRVEVTFARHDMADAEQLPFGEIRFDVIVSNPPYIPASDRVTMHRNVTDYEPSLALFVPDDDKLWCYSALSCLAQSTLNPDGCLYAETYHDFHNELAELFHQQGFADIQSIRDLNGKLRFVEAERK
ncbi:MAG: peptide chain release factor N(5)-glutamine methyltransferase [Bacteroidales bacterium]|nr:peptide chain release factor N(5)-glutamine methyltransferase [Bacteroidales bacterium]